MRSILVFVLFIGLGVSGQAQSLKGRTIGAYADKKESTSVTVGGVKGTLHTSLYKGKIYEISWFSDYIKDFEFIEDFIEAVNEKYEIVLQKDDVQPCYVAGKGNTVFTLNVWNIEDLEGVRTIQLMLTDLKVWTEIEKAKKAKIINDF